MTCEAVFQRGTAAGDRHWLNPTADKNTPVLFFVADTGGAEEMLSCWKLSDTGASKGVDADTGIGRHSCILVHTKQYNTINKFGQYAGMAKSQA